MADLTKKIGLNDVADKIAGKRVVMRVDFNVPIKDGAVGDATRIKAAVPTIKKLLELKAAGVVLLSHLGRPDGRKQTKFTLQPTVGVLAEQLGSSANVSFADDCASDDTITKASALKENDVMICENVRFYAEEEGKGVKEDGEKFKPSSEDVAAFRAKLTKLGDIYVNDAFGTAHRAHSSMVGVDLPLKVAGLLLQKELEYFGKALSSPAKPFLAILGGAKVKDKIQLIENLLDKVDIMIIGGGMAFTFRKVLDNMAIGGSLFDEDGAKIVGDLMAKAKAKNVEIILPVDFVCGDKFSKDAAVKTVTMAEGVPDGWIGMDCGPETVKLNAAAIAKAKTTVWNGPQGVFEWDSFAAGSLTALDNVIDNTKAGNITIIGGGDTASLVENAGKSSQVSHVSTGGGASLELLEGKDLPGVTALSEK